MQDLEVLSVPPVKPHVTGWPTIQQTFEKILTDHDPNPVATHPIIMC